MEPQELSPALLQPLVTVVATLSELLATLPSGEEMKPFAPLGSPSWELQFFIGHLRATLYRMDDIWRRRNVTSNDDEPPTSLSQALATYKSTPGTIWDRVTMATIMWQWSVDVLGNSCVQLAKKARRLRHSCRDLATKAADMAATATARARELQDEAAHDGTAQENMVELGQALGREERAEVVAGHESRVREEATEAASEARRATMVGQRVEVALGLLERLVAACDEAIAFPRELQRLLRDTKAALEGTNEASPNVPEALVAKVALAERLWEANARLAKDHLGKTLPDIIDCLFSGDPASSSACGVAERCQRAMEDIPRLVQPPEHPQDVPKLSPALLHPPVTVVAILGELLATWCSLYEVMRLLQCQTDLYNGLEDFTGELRHSLRSINEPWWEPIVPFGDNDAPASLMWALSIYKGSVTCSGSVTQMARRWEGLVSASANSWAQLARKATKLCNTWREVATKAADRAGTATARAREVQDEAAHDGTAQENMVELGQALGREEVAEVVARNEAKVRRQAMVAASGARRATMVRRRAEVALGLLERLVAACDEATELPRELQRLLRDIQATLKGTNEASPKIPEGLVAKVAEGKRLWEANIRLAKDHLLMTLDDIIEFYFIDDPDRPSFCRVAEQCHRAIEEIPNLLQG